MTINKIHPSVNSVCMLDVRKIVGLEPTASINMGYWKEGVMEFDLEDAATHLDKDFRYHLMKCRLGEVCEFATHTLNIKFVIKDIKRKPPIYKLTNEEKLQRALHLKDKGKDFFKVKKFAEAFEMYKISMKHVLFISDRAKYDAAVNLYTALCTNMALIQMQLHNFKHSISLCTKALQGDKNNVKALYRRGVSYTETKDFEKAHEDLTQARMLQPNNTSALKQLQFVQIQLKREHNQYKELVKRMFTQY